MELTAYPQEARQGLGAGLVQSNGQRGSGQSIVLSGTVDNGGQSVPCQVEVRLEHQNAPLNFSDEKQYTVTVEEVV